MYRTFLSKTNYCKYLQCPKMLWLKNYKRNKAVQAASPGLFETGKKVGIVAQNLFGKRHDDVAYHRNMNYMFDLTSQYLQNKPNIITEATFMYDNNFCMVDILKNDADGMELYEVKSSTGISDIYIDDASFQYYIVTSLGFNVKKVCIVHINRDYVRGKELDLDELFIIEDITHVAIEKQEEIRDNIEKINRYMRIHDRYNEPGMDIGMHCITPYDCDFWQYCTRNLTKPNVFDVNGMDDETKFQKYDKGKVSFSDLINEELTVKQLEQIDFELNDRKDKIEKEEIKNVLGSLQYPLYFLDYEKVMLAIPEIENTRPYRPQLPFQYSLHIINEEGALPEHREFLAQRDDKDFVKHFTESLIENISPEGSVIVYSKSVQTINNSIKELYPEYMENLERINANMVDFMEIFEQRKYYTKQMKGSYLLRDVLSALYPNDSQIDYNNLELVRDDDEASAAFLTLCDKSSDEQRRIMKELREYSKLNTYALLKIYYKFIKVTDDS